MENFKLFFLSHCGPPSPKFIVGDSFKDKQIDCTDIKDLNPLSLNIFYKVHKYCECKNTFKKKCLVKP